MAQEDHPYVGVLYVGLMIDEAGRPAVVEFNVRFGDPETQPLVMQMASDLVPLLDGAARGALDRVAEPRFDGAAVCVVLASGGYPRAFDKGKRIEGLDALERSSDVVVFHAGMKRSDGDFVTSGGRVLGVTARGDDVDAARKRAYSAVGRLRFDGMHFRRDIAARALSR
jgi:phosphoribosylamine--glycine ligase